MGKLAASLIAGLLFAIGLIVSGMVNPAKVINFLDIAGHWDPTLAFVMAGAIAMTLPGFKLAEKMDSPLFEEKFSLPTRKDLDARLITGAALFGCGWGIAGICPGPSFTALASGLLPIAGFVLAMIIGAFVYKKVDDKLPI